MDQEKKGPREAAVAYAVEGLPDQLEISVPAGATGGEILERIKARHGEIEIAELLIEDEEEAIRDDMRILERVEEEFKLLHASRGGGVAVRVRYDKDEVSRTFKPSATIRSILRWAVEDGFELVEPARKFVLKLGERVLEPELHLGQITHGAREIELALVHGRKIQG